MPYPIRLDGLLAKVEGSYGTDSVPVIATDAVRVSQRVWSSLQVDWAFPNDRPDAASGSLIHVKPAKAHGRVVTIDAFWEAKGAGSSYNGGARPEADGLFLGCGCSATPNAAPDSVKYQQVDLAHPSCTIYAYAGGFLFKIVGCRGSMRMPWKAGLLGIVQFHMQGLLITDPLDTALPAGIAYDAQEPLASVGYGLAIGAWTPSVISSEFDQGAPLDRLDSDNGTDGIDQFDFADSLPKFSVSAKTPASLATYNPYTDPAARTARAIALATGTVQFDRMKFNVTNAYLNTHKNADQAKYTAWDLEYLLADWNFVFD